MSNLSGIKKVEEIIISEEMMVFDKPKGGREKSVLLEKDREYIVPEYQREIKWSTENVQVLIDDLIKGSKFLGTITLCTSKPKKFEIIDGQQRLTVITLLINCINEGISDEKRLTRLCKIRNQTFSCFENALSYKFDYERIKNENISLYNKIIETDIQNQRFRFAEIWKSIQDRVELLSTEERERLLLALRESELNIIVNEIDETDTQRKFCVDYFIDINNKSVDLESLDIIRAYAFKEDFYRTIEKWVSIQKKCKELSNKVKYTREELYYQYFICNVNKEIGYSISKLSNDYKIKESVEISGKKYASGTYVWNMFKNDKYYSKLLSDIDEYLAFVEIVVGSENGGNDTFKNYFCDEKGERIAETRILNAHTVINTILRNDDMVPKMMVMKYFLEVLKPKCVKKKSYKIISYINVIATIFTLSTKRKGSSVISGKLLQKDWQNEIREYANRLYPDVPGAIGFAKIIKENGSITTDSGLHAARRYFSMTDACDYVSNSLKIHEDIFIKENISSGENNIEHFIINRGYSFALYNEDGKTVDINIVLPLKYRKYIATLANYLLMNSDINAKLKNRPVFEKVELLEKVIDKKGIDSVIPSITSQKFYYLVKKYMHDESKYPKKRLASVTKITEKKKLLRSYYTEHFFEEYSRLVNSLCTTSYFIAATEYKLKKEGFSLNDGRYMMDHDSLFSVEAEIDEKNKSITMLAELYNPMYGEDNGREEYNKLIDRTTELFKEYFGDEPEVHSSFEYSDCEDESFTFVYSIEPMSEKIIEYITGLYDISSEIETWAPRKDS